VALIKHSEAQRDIIFSIQLLMNPVCSVPDLPISWYKLISLNYEDLQQLFSSGFFFTYYMDK